MNTDRIQEIQKQTGLPNSQSVKQALLQVWNECEAQADTCEECSTLYMGAIFPCNVCSINPKIVDRFTQKKDDLYNLFIGAPVMVLNHSKAGYFMSGYSPKNFTKRDIKLPTVAELKDNNWINKWFAPWPEMPPELKKIKCLHKMKDGSFFESIDEIPQSVWANITAIMIVQDFKI